MGRKHRNNSKKSGGGAAAPVGDNLAFWDSDPLKTTKHHATVDEFVGQKMKEYMEDSEVPLSPIDAYHAAMDKASANRYKMNPSQYQSVIPHFAAGHARENPRISFRIVQIDNQDGSVMSAEHDHVHVSDYMLPMDHEQNAGDVADSNIIHTRESEECASIHINTPLEQEIPSSGTWKVAMSGLMRDGDAAPTETEVTGDYDIRAMETLCADELGHDETVTIRANMHAPQNEEYLIKHNLPRSQLVMQVRRTPDQRYYLRNARVLCTYNQSEREPIGSNDFFYPDAALDAGSCMAPLLQPKHFGARIERAVGHRERATEITVELERWQDENFSADEKQTISISVSHSGGGGGDSKLYESVRDSGVTYGAGEVTRVLTAITLLRLLQQKGFDWSRYRNDCRYVTECALKNTCVGRAVKKLYRRSCGVSGPSLIQLLTNTAGLGSYLDVRPDDVYEKLDVILSNAFTGNDEEFAAEIARQNLVHRPGTMVKDSTVGWAIVGVIIRKLSGTPCVTIPITQTAKLLGMNHTYMVGRGQYDERHGAHQAVFAANHGLVTTGADLGALQQRFRSEVEVIPGMNSILRPQFLVSQQAPAATCIGWSTSPMLNEECDACEYTTVDCCGHTGYGDYSRLTFVPELGLNIMFAAKGLTASRGAAMSESLVRRAVSSVRNSGYLTHGGCPSVPVQDLRLCSMPPYYSNACSHKLLKRRCGCTSKCACPAGACTCGHAKRGGCASSCHNRLRFNASVNFAWNLGGGSNSNRCCDSKSARGVLYELVNAKVAFLPLFGQCKSADELRVGFNKDNGRYTLVFTAIGAIGAAEKGKQDEALELELVEDKESNTLRVLEDELPGDVVHVFRTEGSSGSPVWGISVHGMPYFNIDYVLSKNAGIAAVSEEIGESIDSRIYAESTACAKDVEAIGARWVLPAALLGLGAAGAGFIAGAAASRGRGGGGFYNGYQTAWDPYLGGSVYANPGYIPPLWGYGGFRRYPRRTWDPYYGRYGGGRFGFRPRRRLSGRRGGRGGGRGPRRFNRAPVRRARQRSFRRGARAGRRRIRSNIMEETEDRLQLLNKHEQNMIRAQGEHDVIHAGLT